MVGVRKQAVRTASREVLIISKLAEYLTYTAYFMKVFICYTIYALFLFFLKCFILQKETFPAIIDPLVVALKEGRKCFI